MKRLEVISNAMEARFGERMFRLLRYLISGGTAALVNWSTLFLLVHIGSMYYLYASVISFIVSIGVSFAMQKFWTFQDNVVQNIHAQFSRYLVVIFGSLALNTALVYLLVETAHIWYLLAQVTATAVVATVNFFCYKHFVFNEHPSRSDLNSIS